MEQTILNARGRYEELAELLREKQIQKVLLVAGNFVSATPVGAFFEQLPGKTGIGVVRFRSFEPNPRYESVVEGVRVFRQECCEAIVAVGGGSAMDVAKCIKLFSNMDEGKRYLEQPIVPNDIPLIAVPTTAGTGSEATRYSIIYDEGEKQTITDDSAVPDYVLFDASFLETLPLYHKRAPMMDALCHSTESFWSVNSTPQSRAFSRQAIEMIFSAKDSYLAGEKSGHEQMLMASNIAGKAINISQTTAGHAMSYKLTSLYGLAHGHAVAVCIPAIWEYMIDHTDRCADARGQAYLEAVFEQLAEAYGCREPRQAPERVRALLNELELTAPAVTDEELEVLAESVNPTRLKNNPVPLSQADLKELYSRILGVKDGNQSI